MMSAPRAPNISGEELTPDALQVPSINTGFKSLRSKKVATSIEFTAQGSGKFSGHERNAIHGRRDGLIILNDKCDF